MGHVVLLGYLVKYMGIYVHMKKEENKLPYCVLSQWFCFDFILMCAQHSTKYPGYFQVGMTSPAHIRHFERLVAHRAVHSYTFT